MTTAAPREPEQADETEETSRRGGLLGSAWVAAVLTAVVVGLAVFTGIKVYDAVAPSRETGTGSGSAGDVQLVDADARAEVIEAATDLSERVLTYHHDTFDEDIELAQARLTADFRGEYASAMEQVRASTARNRISQEATAVASSIISATAERAQVLVFINQQTTSARTRADQMARNRLVVDLVRDEGTDSDGPWAIAGVNALD